MEIIWEKQSPAYSDQSFFIPVKFLDQVSDKMRIKMRVKLEEVDASRRQVAGCLGRVEAPHLHKERFGQKDQSSGSRRLVTPCDLLKDLFSQSRLFRYILTKQ